MTGTASRPEEREIISRELARDEKVSTRYLGRLLGRDNSGIAKEITRNGGRTAYRATAGNQSDPLPICSVSVLALRR